MGEEIIEEVKAEEFKTPQISTRLQAFSLIFTGLAFFWANDRKKLIFLLIASLALSVILYNNINLLKEIYSLTGQQP